MSRSVLLSFALLLVPATPAGAEGWRWPVDGQVITPYRNGSDPYAAGQHRGIDIAAGVGTPVVAATGGTVRFAGVAGSSGVTVSVRTADGAFDTSYLHLSGVAVKKGQAVSAGDTLGSVGTSGTRSAEVPHLHFGVREAGTRHAYRDPLDFLPPPPAPPAAPEAPPAAPVAAPAPVRTAPAPVGRRVPAGRRVPVGRRAPAGRRTPERGPVPMPRPAPVPDLLPGTRSGPLPATRPEPRPLGRPSPMGTGGRVPGMAPAPRPAALIPSTREPQATANADPRRSGPEVGWALACLGLLLAAGCIGLGRGGSDRSGGSDRPPVQWRSALAALLRPLARRG